MVAVRIALRILHVADERIVPISEPKRAIGTDLGVGGTEVFVGRFEQVRNALAVEPGAVLADFPARDAIHVNNAGVNEMPLDILREMAADNEFAADDRAHAFVVEDWIQAAAAAFFEAGEGSVPMLLRASAITDEALAPLIEDIAPWIAVTGRDEVADFHGARIDHVGTGRIFVAEGAVGSFECRGHGDTFVGVEQAAVGPFEAATMMRDLLSNKLNGARRDAVLLNTAGALAAETGDFKSALEEAKEALDNGNALNKLDALVEFSKSFS